MWPKLLTAFSRHYLSGRTARRPPRPLDTLEPEKVRRVLLISTTGLGDTLFSTPAVRALKETFPAWSLEVLTHRAFGVLLSHNPYVDGVWAYPGRNRQVLGLIRGLRQRRFDLAVILHGNDPEATMLAYLSGAPYLIGSAGSPLALVYAASPAPADPMAHAIERRLDYVRLLGADTADKRMDLFLAPEESQEAAAMLSRHFGQLPPLLLALHPTGSDPYKWWPAESFIQLGNYLVQTYEAPLLIISGSRDRPQAEAVAAGIKGPTLVTGGRYGLRQVAALLARCRLLVANDSGPLHMGLALGVPSIALLGADHPARVGPYQVEWGAFLSKRDLVCDLHPCLLKKCPDNRCLKAIQVSEVAGLVDAWWSPRFLRDKDP